MRVADVMATAVASLRRDDMLAAAAPRPERALRHKTIEATLAAGAEATLAAGAEATLAAGAEATLSDVIRHTR
jgi:hypothetical protein